jgi:hypothetical protein
VLKLNDFILLKAIFCEALHDAVLAKDEGAIREVLDTRYEEEMDVSNKFVELEPIDTERLYKEHNEQINDEELLRRLI